MLRCFLWADIYISRDVVFDEKIFPFSELHENAGARLRTEVKSLPSLFSFEPGGIAVGDQSTNCPLELANDTVADTEQSTEQNDQDHAISDGPPGAEHEADSSGGAGGSASGSAPTTAEAPSAGVPIQVPPATSPSGKGRHTHGTSTDDTHQATEPAPVTASDSSAHNSATNQPVASDRPRTRLQDGIRKEKVYTDGTVKYGFLTSTGEPCSVDEALGDKNWKAAMDLEYEALMKNNT